MVRVDDNLVRWRLAVGAVHPVFFWTGLALTIALQPHSGASRHSQGLWSYLHWQHMGLVGWRSVSPEVAVVTRASSSSTFGGTSAGALFRGSVWWVAHAHRHRRDAWRLPVVLVLFVASLQARLDVWVKDVILDTF